MRVDSFNSQKSIHQQIEEALIAVPNLASTLHGQRKVHQGSVGKRTALFPSYKNGGMIPLESRLELAHAIALEKDPTVEVYRTQALKIQLSFNEFIYPDFLIKKLDHSLHVHEVKPYQQFVKSKQLDRFKRLERILDNLEIEFKVIDLNNLYSQSEVNNLLYQYQRGHYKKWTAFEINLALSILQDRFQNQHPRIDKESIKKLFSLHNLDLNLYEYIEFHSLISFDNTKFGDDV